MPGPMIPFIDLSAQYRENKAAIRARIDAVLEHGQYILGPEVFELERTLAEYVGTRHCIAVGSGSDALLIALMALGVGPGDEVITTPFSFIATAEMIALTGARPVFADIDPATYNIDPAAIAAAVTPRTRAILPVSLYGRCVEMDAIQAVAASHGLPVIEDGAQSFGATYGGKRSCGLSTIGATSFYPSKPLGCYGEGGALFTDDDALAEAMGEFRVHGQDHPYRHSRLGLNGRLDTLQAAILLAKFETFEAEIRRRAEVGGRYNALLRGIPGVSIAREPDNDTHVHAQYTLEVDQRDAFAALLREEGVPTALHYPVPLHLQPAFAHLGHEPGDFPASEAASKRVLSLPMSPFLQAEQQDQVVNAVRKAATRLA